MMKFSILFISVLGAISVQALNGMAGDPPELIKACKGLKYGDACTIHAAPGTCHSGHFQSQLICY